VIGALAQWGYDWAWSAPREGEEVSIGAIFRSAPGHLHPPPSAKGVLEMNCRGDRGGVDRSYVLTVAKGAVSISELPVEDADARVSGAVGAWVAALGPDGDTSGLEVSGNHALAQSVLKGLVDIASQRVAA
jgi:hypothetical protein